MTPVIGLNPGAIDAPPLLNVCAVIVPPPTTEPALRFIAAGAMTLMPPPNSCVDPAVCVKPAKFIVPACAETVPFVVSAGRFVLVPALFFSVALFVNEPPVIGALPDASNVPAAWLLIVAPLISDRPFDGDV